MTEIPQVSLQKIFLPESNGSASSQASEDKSALGLMKDAFVKQAANSVKNLIDPPPRDLCKPDGTHTADKNKEQLPSPSIDLLPVPDTRQCTDFSCGAGALQSVLMYYGEEYLETELMKMLNTTPNGTNPRDIARVAGDLGHNAVIRENLTIDDLKSYVKLGIPVIISAQAWREGEDLSKPWSELWENGHYMVVIGVDDKNVYFEDPSILGSRGVIPREEFLERWHDIDEKKYIQMGIIISGKKPSPPPPFLAVLSSPPVFDL